LRGKRLVRERQSLEILRIHGGIKARENKSRRPYASSGRFSLAWEVPKIAMSLLMSGCGHGMMKEHFHEERSP
jgi:hypothetical protein